MSQRPQSGDPAPGFDLLDQEGDSRPLTGYRGRPLVLFFYPKASTPG